MANHEGPSAYLQDYAVVFDATCDFFENRLAYGATDWQAYDVYGNTLIGLLEEKDYSAPDIQDMKRQADIDYMKMKIDLERGVEALHDR